MDDAFEHRLHGIEILLGNGVELMVVASGAPNRQAKESGTGHAHHVGQFVGPLLLPEQGVFAVYDILGASHDKAGGGVFSHRVPGNLFKDKAVVGFVLVEGPDYVVAVVVGIGPLVVGLEAGAVGVANDVQPMTGPAFPVTWVLKDFFNELFIGILPFVRYKSFHFFGRWQQAQHIQVDPSDERVPRRLLREVQTGLFEPLADEGVNVFATWGLRNWLH